MARMSSLGLRRAVVVGMTGLSMALVVPVAAQSVPDRSLPDQSIADQTVQDVDFRTQIEFVSDRYFDTPDGRGLLPTALAEAAIANEYAQLAQRDSTGLSAIRRYATYVLHAIDPELATNGPGLGYGIRKATVAAQREMGVAMALDSLSDNVRLHGRHIVDAIDNVVLRADEVVVLANEVAGATSLGQARALLGRLARATDALYRGVDANGDGLRGWPDGDEGLQQASYHLTLLMRGEGWSVPTG